MESWKLIDKNKPNPSKNFLTQKGVWARIWVSEKENSVLRLEWHLLSKTFTIQNNCVCYRLSQVALQSGEQKKRPQQNDCIARQRSGLNMSVESPPPPLGFSPSSPTVAWRIKLFKKEHCSARDLFQVIFKWSNNSRIILQGVSSGLRPVLSRLGYWWTSQAAII